MKLSYNDVKALYGSKEGFRFYDDGAFNLNMFGIRTRRTDVVDEYNDILGVAFRDVMGNGICMLSKGTTKPGLYWLGPERMGSGKGTFILMPGYYPSCWKLGEHKGYPAFVQKGMPFKGWRDNDKDKEFDFHGDIFTDVTGLNMHRASAIQADTDKVSAYSAGCQVRQSHNEHEAVYEFAQRQVDIHGDGFSYALFLETDLR